jgi:hypothetical protein
MRLPVFDTSKSLDGNPGAENRYRLPHALYAHLRLGRCFDHLFAVVKSQPRNLKQHPAHKCERWPENTFGTGPDTTLHCQPLFTGQEWCSTMNVRRGLFRAWALFSLIWLTYIGVLAYNEVPAEIASTKYSYVYQLRTDIDPDNTDWSRPLYEIVRSPSDEKLDSEFGFVDPEYLSDLDKDAKEGKMNIIEFPDHSKLYLSSALTEADQTYLSRQFWDQRSVRLLKILEPGLAAAAIPPTFFFCWASGPCG